MTPDLSAGDRVRADIMDLSAALRAHLDAGRHDKAAALLRRRLAKKQPPLPVGITRPIQSAQ